MVVGCIIIMLLFILVISLLSIFIKTWMARGGRDSPVQTEGWKDWF